MIHHFARLPFLMCLFALALGACTPTIANRGNIIDPDKLAEVAVGTSTRENVANLLGTPTQVSTFDENVWYYIGRNTEQYSFLDPEVIKQKAVEIHFNEEGLVSEVKTLDPALALAITPVSRKTPTYGHETTVLEQLVGNIGSRAGGIGSKEKK